MNPLLRWVRNSVSRLSRVPWAFDALRFVLEGGHRAHRQLIANTFKCCPGRILDCGCGTGIYAREFPRASYVGIDLCPGYIERANECYPGYDFRVMDATRMGFPAESFDAAIVSGVLHHLDSENAGRVLGELHRVLKPDGELLVWEDVPTRSAWNIIGRLAHRLDVGEHIRPSDGYLELLSPCFHVERTCPLRSGFMDYGVFHCLKPLRLACVSNDPPISGTLPAEPCPAEGVNSSL